MIWWTLQWIIVSLTLIALLHYLYTFFKNTLTIPKIKDLVHKPSESYNKHKKEEEEEEDDDELDDLEGSELDEEEYEYSDD